MAEAWSRLLIVGCGYLGLALSRHMHRRGWTVFGLRRGTQAAQELARCGAQLVVADLTQPATLAHLPLADAVVACVAPGPQDDFRATYVDGARHLIEALTPDPPRRLLWVSTTAVYGQKQGEWVDEATPPQPATARAKLQVEAEAIVQAAPFPTVILRLAGLYGPGRDRLRLLKEGEAPLYASAYLNQIHVDDAVGMIEHLLARSEPESLYLGADDEPVMKTEFYGWLAKTAGIGLPLLTRPIGDEHALTNKRCTNKKIKISGYRFKYPNYRVGFTEVLRHRAEAP
jgi:nucleoside-diphosphate-sugar epimerase